MAASNQRSCPLNIVLERLAFNVEIGRWPSHLRGYHALVPPYDYDILKNIEESFPRTPFPSKLH